MSKKDFASFKVHLYLYFVSMNTCDIFPNYTDLGSRDSCIRANAVSSLQAEKHCSLTQDEGMEDIN